MSHAVNAKVNARQRASCVPLPPSFTGRLPSAAPDQVSQHSDDSSLDTDFRMKGALSSIEPRGDLEVHEGDLLLAARYASTK